MCRQYDLILCVPVFVCVRLPPSTGRNESEDVSLADLPSPAAHAEGVSSVGHVCGITLMLLLHCRCCIYAVT